MEKELVIGDPEGHHVSIRPRWRCYPDQSDYYDGNWIESEVVITVSGFRGSFRASLRAEDFENLRDQLRDLFATLEGTAFFDTMEQQLAISLAVDGKGHIMVNGIAADCAGIGNRLEFTFEIDQTYLPPMLQSLDEIIAEFPVQGHPDA